MKLAFVNGCILDGTARMEPLNGRAVLTDGDRIVAVVPRDTDYPGYKIVDLGGQYLMPGLINLHVHLPGSGKPKKKQPDNAKLVKMVTANAVTEKVAELICQSAAKTQLMSGVTTIRTVGGIKNLDTKLRDRINAGKAVGPRILAGDMAVSVPGGHMAGSLAYAAVTPEDAKFYVKQIAKNKPDLIKLMITGGVLDATEYGEPGVVKMAPELVAAACQQAHALGLKVAAHVESPEGVRIALAGGVDTIEHGAKPDEEILELFRKNGACHVATFSPALPYALFDSSISHATQMEQYNGKIVFDGVIACAKACLESGIPVGLGTDTGCPYVTHYDMWREINYFHKYCGVSRAFALHTATQINARILGLEDRLGTIAPGKCADLIVTERNPLADLSTLRNVTMVISRGKVYSNPRVKKMPVVEDELDKHL